MNLIKNLLVLTLLVLFPFGVVIRISSIPSAAIYPLDIGIFLLFIFWIVKKILNKEKINLGEIKNPLIIFIFISFLSILANIKNLELSQILIAFLYLIRWILYASVYLIVKEFDIKSKKEIIRVMLGSGSIIIFLGYVQYIFYPNLRNLYYLGWDEHLYRMFSTFLDPNFAGIFFILFFLLITGSDNIIKAKKYKVPKIFLGGLTFLSIFLTYSRAAMVSLFLGFLIFLLLLKRKGIIALFSLLFILMIFISVYVFSFKSEGTNLLRRTSVNARILSMQEATEVFVKNPVLGVGFGAYRYAQLKYGFIPKDNWQDIHSGAGTDNSYLLVLATTGIIGLISYLYLLISIFKIPFKRIRTMNNSFNRQASIIFISTLTVITVGSFFINALFYSFFMIWLWILLGITESS